MSASPAPRDSSLMKICTFEENFGENMANKTCLCYQVEPPEGDSRIPVDKLKGFLLNKSACTPWGRRHAELCFLDRIHSWDLDKEQHYQVTLFISWSPCPDCAQQLVTFLGQNSHVSLCIFAARIYDIYKGYDDGLQQLKAAGAQIAIMKLEDFRHCWETFVDLQYQPWPNLEEKSQILQRRLEDILGETEDGAQPGQTSQESLQEDK